jgi:hypothetical protein
MNDDHGYQWIETTTPAELNEGRRTYMRGAKIDPRVEPYTIQTNDGLRVCWIDQANQEHWVRPNEDCSAKGWRRIYVEVKP